ncbi:MAG: hypothetical protein ABIG39_02440 [Candidatus Micrarchaeota archaeon]
MNRIAVVCCLISIVAILLLLTRGSGETSDIKNIVDVAKLDNSEAIEQCKHQTPFVDDDGKNYYGRSCLLYVACKVKETSYKMAINTCREINNVTYVEGDGNITDTECIGYIENC